jgi:hypothetical protein
MMPTVLRRFVRLGAVAVAVLTIIVAGACAAQPMTQPPAAGAVAPGQARIWFYRVFFPDDSGGMPAVSLNGSTIGYARAGYSFYRDVPAGTYQVGVASVGNEGDQTGTMTLAPGEQAYLAIQSDPTWMSDRPGFRQPTYALGSEPPRIVAIHMAQVQLGTGY